MKKLSLILILVLLFTLVSCKTETEKPDTDVQNNVSGNVEEKEVGS